MEPEVGAWSLHGICTWSKILSPDLESGPGAWGLDFESRLGDLSMDLMPRPEVWTWWPGLESKQPGFLEPEPRVQFCGSYLESEPLVRTWTFDLEYGPGA